MDSKIGRLILATTMSAFMVLMVTLVATVVHIGFAPDFIAEWLKSYIVSWPIAATTAYVIMPMARRFTGRVVTLIGAA